MNGRLVVVLRALGARPWTKGGCPTPRKNGQFSRSFNTSNSVSEKLFSRRTRILINASEKLDNGAPESQSSAADATSKEASAITKKAGKVAHGGVHIMVPIEAGNAEKAWRVWSTQMRCADISHSEQLVQMSKLVKLIVYSANSTDSADIFTKAADSSKGIIRQKPLARFRVAAILRYVFRNVADTIAATTSTGAAAGSPGNASKEPILTLRNAENYRALLSLLANHYSPQKDIAATGNSPTSIGKSSKDLEADLENARISRLAYLVLLSATRESVAVTQELTELALEAAIVFQDVMAGRDCLLLFNPSLALLIDPRAPVNSKAYSSTGIAGASDKIVDLLLRLVAVGRDPYETSEADRENRQLQADRIDILADADDAADGSLANQQSGSTEDAVLRWRVETAERIYKAYISAGITEVPSPDKSSMPSLLGSVVPQPSTLVTMLGVFAAAGNIDQAIVVYDTLVATLKQSPCLGEQASGRPGLQENPKIPVISLGEAARSHKMSSAEWIRVFSSIYKAKQGWLLLRVLEDLCADGWVPSVDMYEEYLGLMADHSKESLESTVDYIRGIAQSSNRPEPFVDNLTNALLKKSLCPSEDVIRMRIEQALLISGLPLQEGDSDAPAGQDKALVSDDTARALVNALIFHGQIDRARRLGEVWNMGRPYLIGNYSLSKLILGLACEKKYAQALQLFSEIQQASSDEISVDILGSVLQVYVRAGDFEEAVSVAKRIRAITRREKREIGLFDAPHVIYNCMIQAYCETDQVTEALRVLEEMRGTRVKATFGTYTILVQTMSRIRSYDGLKLVVALVNVDYNLSTPTHSSVYFSAKQLSLKQDYYNALIEAYGRVAEPAKALQVWEIMRQRGIGANCATASLLIDTCGWNERVHWDQDLLPTADFVYRDVPEDHVYTGMPFMHMHYLASLVKQLLQSGHEFSLANYRHLLEALIRGGFVEDAFDMVIGRFEGEEAHLSWANKAQMLLNPKEESALSRIFGLFKPETDEKEAKGDTAAAENRTSATFMDDFSMDIPLCQNTVNTLFGMVSAVRDQCVQGEDVDPVDMPFVQRASHNLLRRLDLQEQRLREFLKKERPDLLPPSA